MSVAWSLTKALRDLLSSKLEASVSIGLPNGMSSGDYVALAVTDPEAAGRPASAYTSDFEWADSVAPTDLKVSGEVSLAIVAVRGDDDLEAACDAVEAILDQIDAEVRGAWSSHDLLGVPGLWDLRLSSTEANTTPLDGASFAYLLARYTFQALI